MTTLTAETVVSQQTLDHPAQLGWLERGREAAAELELVGGTPIAKALSVASVRSDDYRQYHEAINLFLLQPSAAALETYQVQAGRPEFVVPQLRLFGTLALNAFSLDTVAVPAPDDGHYCQFCAPTEYDVDKIALELGGVRVRPEQLAQPDRPSSWNTETLDALEHSIKPLVEATDPRAAVWVMESPEERRATYSVYPIVTKNTHPDRSLKQGLVRRRRPVANVYLPETDDAPRCKIEVFKESTGLYDVGKLPHGWNRFVLSSTPRQYRAAENEAQGDAEDVLPEDRVDLKITHDMLTDAAGVVFEEAIEAYKRKQPTNAVHHVSAHLIMLCRRPDA